MEEERVEVRRAPNKPRSFCHRFFFFSPHLFHRRHVEQLAEDVHVGRLYGPRDDVRGGAAAGALRQGEEGDELRWWGHRGGKTRERGRERARSDSVKKCKARQGASSSVFIFFLSSKPIEEREEAKGVCFSGLARDVSGLGSECRRRPEASCCVAGSQQAAAAGRAREVPTDSDSVGGGIKLLVVELHASSSSSFRQGLPRRFPGECRRHRLQNEASDLAGLRPEKTGPAQAAGEGACDKQRRRRRYCRRCRLDTFHRLDLSSSPSHPLGDRRPPRAEPAAPAVGIRRRTVPDSGLGLPRKRRLRPRLCRVCPHEVEGAAGEESAAAVVFGGRRRGGGRGGGGRGSRRRRRRRRGVGSDGAGHHDGGDGGRGGGQGQTRRCRGEGCCCRCLADDSFSLWGGRRSEKFRRRRR